MSANAPLWSASALAAATGASVPPDLAATGVSIDSRSLAPGDLFVALAGERDGHDFVAAAFRAGAAAAIVSRSVEGAGPLLMVPDTLEALRRLGEAGRARASARVVAITGSVGKTGTKDSLALALGDQGPTHKAQASFNNHLGVPLTLARLPAESRFAVLEIGMNHRGEIAPLARLASPHIAVITTVAPVHVGHLGSIEAIAEEKSDLFLGLAPGGVAIVHRDMPSFGRVAARAAAAEARILTFGRDPSADGRIVSAQVGADGTDVEAVIEGERVAFRLAARGQHHATNAMAVLLAARAAGAALEPAIASLARVRPGAGRGASVVVELPEGGTALLLDESYNASPPSVAAALAVLGATEPGPGGRRIAVLGDMRELGAFGPQAHQGLLGPIEGAKVELLFACGELMEAMFEAAPEAIRGAWAEDSETLLPVVQAALSPGDVVLVKGSLSMGLGRIARALSGSGR